MIINGISYCIKMIINGISYCIKNDKDIIQKYLLNGKQWNEGIYNSIIHIIKQNDLKHFLNIIFILYGK